ncbi:MAG: hypothetical protein HY782_14820 [Chloroflexi bacterium]|nr:hypothetical protein [Chloroflexota bacterium]
MSGENVQPCLREQANSILSRLLPSQREELLVKCWLSHDARWFMAVAQEYGMAVANRLNQIAAHELGKAEAQRLARALELSPVKTLDDYLLAQEIGIGLFGPDLLDYDIVKTDDRSYQTQVRRCFAFDNAVRAGIAGEYECGIFARITGWLDAFGLEHVTRPSLGKCLKAQGQDCVHTVAVGR